MSSLLVLPDWISHIPKVDDSHGIATVAPAHTMQLEGTYEDFEILGDTAVRQSQNCQGFFLYHLCSENPFECIRDLKTAWNRSGWPTPRFLLNQEP